MNVITTYQQKGKKIMKIILLTIFNSLLMVTGQILWKIGVAGKNLNNIIDIIKVMFSPCIFSGLMIYVGATFLWLYILSKADLSYVYPLQSLAFIFAIFVSIFIFRENVTLNRWIGTIVICLGVAIVSTK